jgi:hypothetical protein
VVHHLSTPASRFRTVTPGKDKDPWVSKRGSLRKWLQSFHHRSLSLPQIIQGGGGRLSNLNLILLVIAMSSFNTLFDQHNYFVWPNSTTLGTTFESADTIDAIFITNHSPAYVSSNCSCNGFKSYFTYATPSTSFTFGGTYVHGA